MRSLVFSLPYDPAKPIADQAEIRRNYFLAAVSTHPEYKEADPQARRDIRNIVMQLPTIVSRKPRVSFSQENPLRCHRADRQLYMKIVNHLHGIDDKDRPQGFPVRSFSLNDDNMLNSAQAKKRLAAGELIVYVDQFEMRVNVSHLQAGLRPMSFSSSFHRTLTSMAERMPSPLIIPRRCFAGGTPARREVVRRPLLNWSSPLIHAEFEWFRIKPGTNDRKINIEVEPNHADRFEQALRKYFPPVSSPLLGVPCLVSSLTISSPGSTLPSRWPKLDAPPQTTTTASSCPPLRNCPL